MSRGTDNPLPSAWVDPPNVAVLVETSTGWGRRMIRGVTGYAQKHGPWHLWAEARGRSEHLILPPDWAGDGVIARISTQRMADAIHRLHVPVVNVSAIPVSGCDFPTVTSDYPATGALAASHFIDRGFRHFAYVGGPLRYPYIREHLAAVRDAIPKTDPASTFGVFDYRYPTVSSRGWARQNQRLAAWLTKLPRPLAVVSWATTPAIHVLDLCRHAGLAVPDDVAVLASDDDDLLCEATSPPLSGLIVASRQIGYRAAERLDALMNGRNDPGTLERFAPIEIITRGSTETLAIEDRELLQAVIFMRQNAYGPLTIQQVADAVPMTRRSLERKFKDNYNRTPLSELHRLRLARAKHLLAETDHPISKVAEACGFGTPEYLATRFREDVGTTPLRYRSLTRAR